MSSVVSTKQSTKVSKGQTPDWDEAQMWRRTRQRIMILAGVVVGIWIFLGRVGAVHCAHRRIRSEAPCRWARTSPWR